MVKADKTAPYRTPTLQPSFRSPSAAATILRCADWAPESYWGTGCISLQSVCRSIFFFSSVKDGLSCFTDHGRSDRFASASSAIQNPSISIATIANMDYTGGATDSVFSIYIFGDQTNSFESDLTQLLHIKGCGLLTSFFERTHYALRLEISRLPTSRQRWFPRFTAIIDLLARKSHSGSNPALELALLCLTQLARFIRYVRHRPRKNLKSC